MNETKRKLICKISGLITISSTLIIAFNTLILFTNFKTISFKFSLTMYLIALIFTLLDIIIILMLKHRHPEFKEEYELYRCNYVIPCATTIFFIFTLYVICLLIFVI